MAQTYAEIEESVKKWWSTLQYERKCNSTNTIYKMVSRSSVEIQDQVRKLIAEEISKVVNECLKSKDLNEMQIVCNAINGCFDNFIHAVDAIKTVFFQVVSFINIGFTECQSHLSSRTHLKNTVLELLHSLSRILILVLKLKRTQISKKDHDIVQCQDGTDLQEVKSSLCELSIKVGQFLLMDDILVDTKNNLSMCGILIREIVLGDNKELIKFHKQFIKTIPTEIYEENFKVDILKFLTSSAIINNWSVDIIDSDAIYVYLKFFILLCESYSSETPIILNTSRTLLLLIKHEAFKNFVQTVKQEKVENVTSQLLSCVFMLLEHPVACIRHSAKDFLHLLAATSLLQSVMIETVFKLPFDKRSFFISLGALANEVGTRILIEKYQFLPDVLLSALKDPTIVSHVSLAFEFVILKDSLAEENFPLWCETWIVPLLVSLMNVLPIVAADIDKLLEKAFKRYPNSIIYITNKWAHPKSGEELRYVITALKISCKQGFKIKENTNFISNGNFPSLDPEKKLMSEDLLKNCLHQRDDDIRISAFSLLIEAHKSTKPYSDRDFKLIMYFLKYNLNNQQPSTRQKILGLIRKMLVRFSDSKATFVKPGKTPEESRQKSENLALYNQFMDGLVEFCFSNIFVGCNFNRLNTVLNVLSLCFENIKDFSYNSSKTDYYWSKLLIALDSSYEENKELAVELSKKLNFSFLTENNPLQALRLYRKAFSLCTHMEPPDVLTGAYLLLTLTNFPSSKEILSKHFIESDPTDDVVFSCIQILVEKLKEQLLMAKLDLMTAATCGPMYGTLFAIRLIFKNFTFSEGVISNKDSLRKWSEVLNELVGISFEMSHAVGCVVNSSSPEGHLPSDFQTNFENLLSADFAAGCRLTDSEGSQNNTSILFTKISENFTKKFQKLKDLIKDSNYDSYEILRSLNCLMKENQILIDKVNYFNGVKDEEVRQLKQLRMELKEVEAKVVKPKGVIDWPATAQVLLLCSWRSIKESSLYLCDFVTKLPIDNLVSFGLVTSETLMKMGEELKILLCEIKHRGAFEHAYIGFTQLVNSLWKCSDKNLNSLPRKWLEEIINQLSSPLRDQKLKLCSTRRSAGLPFLVQAIICSEIITVKSTTPSSLHSTMKSLLEITENGVVDNAESKIHALNILRALFKHAQLGEHVTSYVSRALMVAIRGSRAATWPERNSSNLLFSSLIIRIFGVSRSKDEISKKNRMTSRTFFQRYPELYDFLLNEMKYVYSEEVIGKGFLPKPSLYLILLVLGRLYPPPTEDPDNIDLSEFLPFINVSRRNPIMKVRELAARALVPLVPLDRFFNELDERFSLLSSQGNTTPNEKHGILLQIKALLTESDFLQANIFEEKITWIEKTKYLLKETSQPSYTVLSSYIKVLHILYSTFSPLSNEIAELVAETKEPEQLLSLDEDQLRLLPGVFLFLENFYFFKTDVLAQSAFDSGKFEELVELFTFMMGCGVLEVECIPLKILRFVMGMGDHEEVDDDDFYGIGTAVKGLKIFSQPEATKKLESSLTSNSAILHLLMEKHNAPEGSFASKVAHRLWFSVVSILVMKGIIPVSNDCSNKGMNIIFVKRFLKSGDKDLSTTSLVCYAVYLMEELKRKKGEMKTEDILELKEILDDFSHVEADSKERMAVATILNTYYYLLFDKTLYQNPILFSIWMIPFKLLLDEDPSIRQIAGDFVQKIRETSRNLETDTKTTRDLPQLALVSLKAQEHLLDSYADVVGKESMSNLVVQMLTLAASSFVDFDENERYSKDEFGVFEKGNPNPFCEDLAVTELMCTKLLDLRSSKNLDELLENTLDNRLVEFVAQKFNLPKGKSENFKDLMESLKDFAKTVEQNSEDFSLQRTQIKMITKAVQTF